MSHATIFWQDSDIKTTLIKKAVAQNLALSDVSSQCNKTLVIFFKSCCDNKSLKNSWWSRICKGLYLRSQKFKENDKYVLDKASSQQGTFKCAKSERKKEGKS
jgi:hypothetical protein